MIYFSFFLVALLQASLFSGFRMAGVVPNLILVLIVLLLTKEKRVSSMMVGAGGLSLDIFTGMKIGTCTLPLLIVFLCIQWFVIKAVKSENRVMVFSLVLILSTFLYNTIRIFLSPLFEKLDFTMAINIFQYYVVYVLLLECLLNLLFLFIGLWILRYFKTKTNHRVLSVKSYNL